MSNNYYYLVAGLPDLLLDDTKNLPDTDTILSEFNEQLKPEDKELLAIIRCQVDNKNLINILLKKDNYNKNGNFSKEELSMYIKTGDNLPEYMNAFLESHSDKPSLPEDQLENNLLRFFYDYVLCHKSDFIREWFLFELNTKNVITAISCRKYNYSLEENIININDTSSKIIKSTAQDFGIVSEFPEVEKINSLNQENLTDFEINLDHLRWNKLNEITEFSYFGIESILAFIIKLNIVERWKNLNAKEGKERLNQIVNSLTENFHLSEQTG